MSEELPSHFKDNFSGEVIMNGRRHTAVALKFDQPAVGWALAQQ